MLQEARRPVIVAGRGAVLSGARAQLERLGDRIGAVLTTSAVANGFFSGAPYDVGIAGGFSSPFAAELLAQADVVVAFGAGLNRWTTRHGALIGPATTVVQVDVSQAALGRHRAIHLGVVGDAAAVARAVVLELGAGADAEGFRTPRLEEHIAARRWRDEPYEDRAPTGRIDPRTFSRALEEVLPAERTVVVDSGHFTGWPSMFLSVPDASSWVFVNAFQAVGLGLGCAIGAAVARPDRVTVAAVGDGGLFLALQELDTAARTGVRLLIVVYDDAAYGAEVHHFAPLGHDVSTVRFPDTDIAAIARAAGVEAITVRSTGRPRRRPQVARRDEGTAPRRREGRSGRRAAWLEEAFRAA
jgi:thiamine pyrophosphate-dependent acetolactate synthase large subunit-like protein